MVAKPKMPMPMKKPMMMPKGKAGGKTKGKGAMPLMMAKMMKGKGK